MTNRDEYAQKLKSLRAKSEQAMAELRRLQHASTDAFERARRSFDKK